MWIILFAVAFIADRWVFSWWMLAVPVLISALAIKQYPKSIAAWVSLIFAILSVVVFVLITIKLAPYFK